MVTVVFIRTSREIDIYTNFRSLILINLMQFCVFYPHKYLIKEKKKKKKKTFRWKPCDSIVIPHAPKTGALCEL